VAELTDVQICNMGLAWLKGEPISDLETDTSEEAVQCRLFYPVCRDSLLEDFEWAWAIDEQALGVTSDVSSTFVYGYQVPQDPFCLRPLKVLDSLYMESVMPWERKADLIWSDEPAAILRYIARVSESKFPNKFAEALQWKLAASLAKPLAGLDPSPFMVVAERRLIEAKGVSAVSSMEKPVSEPRWTDERFGLRDPRRG
jgi:hypothetical protein